MSAGHIAVLFALTLACAPATQRAGDPPSPTTEVQVSVRNDNLADAVVYAVRLDAQFRLGMVPSHTDGHFRVPVTMLDDNRIQLLVHLVGGSGDFLSEVMQIDDELEPRLDLLPSLDMSTFYAVNRR